MIDIKAIREAAEKATPGPWEYRELEWGNYVTADGQTSVCRSALSSTASMKHIATANPATVLALCDEIERLRTALKPLSNELLLSRWQITPVLDNLEAELCWQDYHTLYEHFAAMHGITGESR